MSKVNQKLGFTIIETMISISLFLVVVVFGMNALLNANVVHQKSQDMRSILDNLSFILEDMGRNIRTGYNYRCLISGDAFPFIVSPQRSCANGLGIALESAVGLTADNADQWVYYISAGKIYKSTSGGASYFQLNPDEVVLDSTSGFSVLGAESPAGNSQQPLVTIRLSGKITYKNLQTPFIMQTSASQRLIDVISP